VDVWNFRRCGDSKEEEARHEDDGCEEGRDRGRHCDKEVRFEI